MATQATSKPPRETPSTPTKAKSAASSVKGSPKSVTSKTQKQVGKDNKTPRKLKRKVDDTITPAAERTSSPAESKELPSRPAAGKKNVSKKRGEQRDPEPEPESEPEPDRVEEQEEPQEEGEEAGIQLEHNDNDNDDVGEEEDDEEEEEEEEASEPSVSAPVEQRDEPADNQSQASGSATGGFFSRTGNGLNSFARGLRGVAGSLSQGNAKGALDNTAGSVKDTAQGSIGDVVNSLPLDLSALKGLEVGEGGKIFDKADNPLGEVVEGEPEDLVGQTVGDDGEILDEDGDLIGRVELLDDVQKKVTDTLDQVKDKLPSLEDLKDLPVSERGEIKDKAGNVLGRIVEGDPEDLVGQTLNESGEILDEDGDLIGRAEVISPEEALKTIQEKGADLGDIEETAEDAGPDDVQDKVDKVKNNLPDLADLDGLPVSDGGEIKDKDGHVVGKVVEGDPEDLVGQTVNDAGEILDEDGDLIGRVEVLSPDEAAQKVTGQVDEAKDKVGDVENQATEAAEGLIPQIQILQGKKINKKGKILDEEGEVIGQIAEGDVKDLAGKKPNERGEVLDKEGNILGKVDVVPGEAADEALKALQEEAEEAGQAVEGLADRAGEPAEDVKDKAEETADGVKDLAALDGLQVNDQGNVVDSEGNVLAKLESGNLENIAGQTVDEKGLVIDDDGNILGRVALVGDATDDAKDAVDGAADEAQDMAEDAQDAAPELPPLSTLEGLKVNKFGKIVNADGVPVGELTEGDAKKISKLGATLDDKGQFWDNRGNIIGKAQTIPVEDNDSEGAFAGLEGLIVVQDGWVEDENGNRVGELVEGDTKKLVGRAVDEDGDILDKRGNVVGRAERYEQPEEPEAEKPDFSSVAGLKPNKAGNVIGPDGIPIARVVEGNLKEVAGRKIDNEGQIWNDSGKVVGRVELIPEDERETKPEGIFGGLEGLIVNKDGLVEDEEGNIVGKIVEGDAKKLRGRAVDEDGDILDKHGNVKGRAEPYEVPEEEPQEDDLSSLEGKKVNKMGNVVDEHGTVFGRIAEGDPKKLAGKRVDGKGQIWSDNGKVIGRAELIPGNEQGKPEGAFFGFDDAKVGKDGVIVDSNDKIIGRLTEGDAKKLVGRPVDEDGDILDKSGNVLGKAERWEPEEKKRDVNPMSGRKVNKQSEIRDENGDLIGKVTDGNLQNLIGKSIDDNGYVVDNDGNKIGEATLIENIPEPEPEPEEPKEEISPEELDKQKQEENDRKLAERICAIVQDTLGKIEPVCKQITNLVEKADRTPKDELDEEKLVNDVKPLLEEGGRMLQECNGAIRALDPDGRIAATAKARAQTHEASPEEYRLADALKELTQTVVKTIDNGRKRIQDMPHAKKKLNPLWSLLTEPLFQIIAAVGLLLSGVLGLVSRLLDGLGLGGLVRGLLGGLGVDKLLEGLGLGSITESLGFGKKK
ncbi:LEA domain protein [Talaromyces stipitatus ATCC 10500]|uniref:LEA domain protein n=1 Tax=Talaromyces stipitatus (strain ATCC 10500 / CBS 375.48 / QM 6759 / NRRL 1006) TaxID=441959 RepID=B8MF87_TALSN|nr:LEA domain protein [Talaromyces stipitatus ATCC 10500]EED16186.1 LEA domain protein [Talaromyces stipitatus ATCC 10500]